MLANTGITARESVLHDLGLHYPHGKQEHHRRIALKCAAFECSNGSMRFETQLVFAVVFGKRQTKCTRLKTEPVSQTAAFLLLQEPKKSAGKQADPPQLQRLALRRRSYIFGEVGVRQRVPWLESRSINQAQRVQPPGGLRVRRSTAELLLRFYAADLLAVSLS